MDRQVLLLEFNEVNFDYLSVYAQRGELPHLRDLIDSFGITRTHSEEKSDALEPWIQWVSAHTGLRYSEHGIFRLGDIVDTDIPQIWEELEARGFRVGAISPMNAKNRTHRAEFFLPDPWTPTTFTGPYLLGQLAKAVSQAVNDNAKARISRTSAAWLALAWVRYALPCNYAKYFKSVRSASKRPWSRSMFLDLLLSDVFVREVRRTQPDFASLFLNGAAHVQHHYMFNSIAYQGTQKNPDWYVAPTDDPVGDTYRLYDAIVGNVRQAFPNARLMIATGLHQDPHSRTTFYWRLKDHRAFLSKVGVPFKEITPLMSRDFVVACVSDSEAAIAQRILEDVRTCDGEQLFEVDNRGADLFVMLVWPNEIGRDFRYIADGKTHYGLRDDVAFVAIKNGEHNGTGYLLDTGYPSRESPQYLNISELPRRICSALGVEWNGVLATR